MYRPIDAPESLKTLKEARKAKLEEMTTLANQVKAAARSFTADERSRFTKLDSEVKDLDQVIATKKNIAKRESGAGDAQIEGRPFELLASDQSVSAWHSRAAANGVDGVRNEGTDRDLNRYWAERLGLAPRSAETRALGEDTAGSGQAIVPQVWSTSFIDVLRPNLVLSDAMIMPMTSEQHTLPQYTADAAPVWVAENGAMSLDANPAFAPVAFNAKGAYMDITLMSRQVAEDTNQQGGLDNLITETLQRKYARLIESAAFFGTTGNVGNPGLVNETGLQHFAAEASLADFDDLSKAAEKVRGVNAEATAAIANPATVGTFERLKASTYAKYWTPPTSVAYLWPPRYTTALPATETAAGAAETGGALSSMFVGDFRRVVIGMRVDVDVRVLNERYADQGQIGLWSYCRFSIRTTHPEAFCRITDIATT
jgi:HK97 family phage major capsid protein